MDRLQKMAAYQKKYYREHREELLAKRKKQWQEFRQWKVATEGLSDPRD